jgi:uncharacterized membrane protein
MSHETYCSFCGSVVDDNAAFCQNCGASVEQKQKPPPQQTLSYGSQPTYQQPQTSTSSDLNDEVEAIIGLVMGILSCLGVLALIGSIVGIILGHVAKRKGDSTLASVSLVVGYLGLFIYIILPLIIVFAILFPLGYI